MRTHRLPPPDSDCVMQDAKLQLLNLQWFRVLGASFSRFWSLRFRSRVLRFRDLGVFVFEFWVLRFRFRVLRFQSRVLRFRDLGASFSRFGCFVLRSSFSSASFSILPFR